MPISTRSDILKNFAKGLGVAIPAASAGSISATAAVAASGHFSVQIKPNTVGTTLPGTLVSYPVASPTSDVLLTFATVAGSFASARMCSIAWIYRIGTLTLSATGDRFTHDAATFPLTRTIMGVTTSVQLVPIVQLTTATATTAPVFRLRTVAGGAGYVSQDGSSVVGTKTMTMPAAATANGSCFMFRLEDGDSAVTDISNIEVTTAGSAGAATIWGVEYLSDITHAVPGYHMSSDSLFGGLDPMSLKPAVATSGTATAYLSTVDLTNNNSSYAYWVMGASVA